MRSPRESYEPHDTSDTWQLDTVHARAGRVPDDAVAADANDADANDADGADDANISQLLSEVFDLADETVAGITDDDVDQALDRIYALDQVTTSDDTPYVNDCDDCPGNHANHAPTNHASDANEDEDCNCDAEYDCQCGLAVPVAILMSMILVAVALVAVLSWFLTTIVFP